MTRSKLTPWMVGAAFTIIAGTTIWSAVEAFRRALS